MPSASSRNISSINYLSFISFRSHLIESKKKKIFFLFVFLYVVYSISWVGTTPGTALQACIHIAEKEESERAKKRKTRVFLTPSPSPRPAAHVEFDSLHFSSPLSSHCMPFYPSFASGSRRSRWTPFILIECFWLFFFLSLTFQLLPSFFFSVFLTLSFLSASSCEHLSLFFSTPSLSCCCFFLCFLYSQILLQLSCQLKNGAGEAAFSLSLSRALTCDWYGAGMRV